MREDVIRGLLQARDAHTDAHRSRRADPAGPARPADESAGLGPRAYRPAGGVLAAARRRPGRGAACSRRTSTRSTTRSSTPARIGRPCRCCRRWRLAPFCYEVRGPRARPARPHADDDLFTARDGRPARAAARRDDARHPSAARRRRRLLGRGSRCRRAAPSPAIPCSSLAASSSSVSTPPTSRASLDNERPATVVDVRPFRIGRLPGQQCGSGSVHRRRRLTALEWWSPRGWAHRVEASVDRPKFWSTDGTRTPLRRSGGCAARRAGTARRLLRGRGIRGMVRRAAAHRDRVGEGVRLGPADAQASPVAVGCRCADGLARQPRWRRAAAGAASAPIPAAPPPTAPSR